MSVVDIGTLRYFDGRAIAGDAWSGYAPFEAAASAVRGTAEANTHVWVLPGEVTPLFDELDQVAASVLLSRFKSTLLETITVATTLVYVDRPGWRPTPTLESAAVTVGVRFVLELPVLLDPTSKQTTREILDEAARALRNG